MAGVTVVPAVLYVSGYLLNHDPANPSRVANAGGVTDVINIGYDYKQGTATYNPHLGQPVPTYSSGSIAMLPNARDTG
jgi:hypothetical protein